MMIKYYNYNIVFQEVPDEVTLAVNLTACPNHCQGCHSPHLWEDNGIELTEYQVDSMLSKYKEAITCFCFMGGDAHPEEVEMLANHIHKVSNLKVAWYSGKTILPEKLNLFQYLKIGPYIPEKGGLKSKTTNQIFYKNIDGKLEDITCMFNGNY